MVNHRKEEPHRLLHIGWMNGSTEPGRDPRHQIKGGGEMLSDRDRAKFTKPGRKKAFALFAGLKNQGSVTHWLKGRASARLDRLARAWRPTVEGKP